MNVEIDREVGVVGTARERSPYTGFHQFISIVRSTLIFRGGGGIAVLRARRRTVRYFADLSLPASNPLVVNAARRLPALTNINEH